MALDQLLKRHFWVVLAPMTGVAGFFGAQGVSSLIAMNLAPDEKALAAPPLAARLNVAQVDSASHQTSADPLFSRNPFDSVTGPLFPKPDASVEVVVQPDGGGEDLVGDPYQAPACDGVKLLIITASSDPDWSFAAFSVGTGDKAKTILRRRGGDVNGKTVRFIRWDRAWLESGHSLCQVTMFHPPPAASHSPAAAPPPPPPPANGAPGVPPDIAKGIQKVGPREFNVDRTVVDKILENQADLMKQARIVPEQENGKLVGIRLYGVRPDTLLGTLGMENGDRLEKINGFDMTSPEKALEAYARLRTADHLTVAINRGGAAANIDFNIK